MKKIIYAILFISLSLNVQAQDLDKIAQEITDEGKYLFRLEKTSWIGTDLFIEKYKNTENLGGYLSYAINEDSTCCIFWNKNEIPSVVGTISFDSSLDLNNASVDISEREMTDIEKELFQIRNATLHELTTDTLFLFYENTSPNIIPVKYKGEKKAYILTGPQQTGVVILGNDYLLTFDEEGVLTQKKRIHNNIISMEYDSSNTKMTVHSHNDTTGDFITPTDICTLMLYAGYAGWPRHYTVSQEYISIWDCKKNELKIMLYDEWEKMEEEK